MNMDNDNIEALYQQKCEEYDNLAIEYEEMRDLSSQIEKELEAEADHLTKEKKKLVEENEKMQHQIQEIKKKYASEVSYLEKVTERLETDNQKMKEEREIKSRTLMQNEIEVERLESQIRESDAVISDLENKIDHVLEKLAMVQSQLEFQKMENEEEVQRLKDQLQESEGEVLACRIRASANNSNLGQLDGQQQSHNPYFDLVLRDRNCSGESEEKRSKKRIPTVELGKRSYFDRDEDSYQTKSKSRASKNQSGASANALDYNMIGFPLEGYSGGQWNELFKENYAHNNLQNFDSFNLINQSFSNSITTVKGMIEDLEKPSQNGMFLSNNQNNLSSTNMFTSSNGAGNL